jgi:alkylation response protein AidB-like acyl-CoA dehydrogenase
MFFEETAEQLGLRRELRSYYADLLTDDVRTGIGEVGEGGALWRQVVRRIGKDGWLGIGWPTEYGGQGRPATDQFIFFDETRRVGAPFPFVTVNTVGPTIMRYGSEEQKSFFLPGILSGEINFAIGYTEPEAGTDLASLRTRAVRDGDQYVVNGAKIFTSGAELADYVWLAVRTDPEAPKHKGISILCVPTDSPGFSYSPITTVAGAMTSATYYTDVHVPAANRVGEENEGWRMITNQLNHERVGLAAWSGFASQLFDEVADWAATAPIGLGEDRAAAGDADDMVVLDLPWVQLDLARCRAELEAMYLLNWRMASAVATDQLKAADSSAAKVFGVETSIGIYRRLLGIVGAPGYLAPGSPGAALEGKLERTARHAQINTFGGGVNEVQREIVAMAGLGMTRGAR